MRKKRSNIYNREGLNLRGGYVYRTSKEMYFDRWLHLFEKNKDGADALFGIFKLALTFTTAFSYGLLLFHCLAQKIPFVEAAQEIGIYIIAFALIFTFFAMFYGSLYWFMGYWREQDAYSIQITKNMENRLSLLALFGIFPIIEIIMCLYQLNLINLILSTLLGVCGIFILYIDHLNRKKSSETISFEWSYVFLIIIGNIFALVSFSFTLLIAEKMFVGLIDQFEIINFLDSLKWSIIILVSVMLYWPFVEIAAANLNIKKTSRYSFITFFVIIIFGMYTNIFQNIANSTMANLRKGGELKVSFNILDVVGCDFQQVLSENAKKQCKDDNSKINAKSGRYLQSRTLHLALSTSDKLYLHLPEQITSSPAERDLIELDRRYISTIIYQKK